MPRTFTPEHRAKISASKLGSPAPNAGKKMPSVSEKAKARWADPAFKAKMKAKMQATWADPAKRARIVAGTQAAWDADDGSRSSAVSAGVSAYRTGRSLSTEHREAIRASARTSQTEETKQKIAESNTSYFIDQAKQGNYKAFEGQRTGFNEDGYPVRYCMCSPVCMVPIRKSGIRYVEDHWLRVEGARERWIAAISAANKGKIVSAATRALMRANRIGKVPPAFRGERCKYLSEDGSKTYYMRSSWELDYARFLDYTRLKWEYECATFPLSVDGERTSYTPDFYLPDSNEYVEVKGYYSDKNKKKMQVFFDTYADTYVRMIFESEMKEVWKDMAIAGMSASSVKAREYVRKTVTLK